MRSSVYLYSLLALLPVALFAAASDDLELLGAMMEGGKASVLLKDKVSGRSRWVVAGDTMAGYQFNSYDPNSGTATVSKDRVNGRLAMKTSKVGVGSVAVAAVPPPPPPSAVAAAADPALDVQRRVLNNLRQLSAAADQYFLENGVSRVNIADLVGPEPRKYIKALIPVAGEDYSKTEISQGKPVIATFPDGSTQKYDN